MSARYGGPLPPDPEFNESPVPEDDGGTITIVMGGLLLLAPVVTVCLLVLHWAGVI